jgi:nitronate monooxygenase
MGASGVQMGTRFAASEESNASDAMKQLYIKAVKEDVVHVKSPVGLPGQAIRNPFFNMVEDESHIKITKCVDCLKRCTHSFCIMDALVNACRTGDFNRALVFSGENVYKIKDILPVHDIFKNLLKEVEEA